MYANLHVRESWELAFLPDFSAKFSLSKPDVASQHVAGSTSFDFAGN